MVSYMLVQETNGCLVALYSDSNDLASLHGTPGEPDMMQPSRLRISLGMLMTG
jgi:hypothetical protein